VVNGLRYCDIAIASLHIGEVWCFAGLDLTLPSSKGSHVSVVGSGPFSNGELGPFVPGPDLVTAIRLESGGIKSGVVLKLSDNGTSVAMSRINWEMCFGRQHTRVGQ
jgi:hypothetical protein